MEQNNHSFRKTLHEVIFKADTPAGKLFDVALIGCILASVGVVMLDSVETISKQYHGLFYGLEWFFTVLFTIEYILRLYCVPFKLKYTISFFGIIDLLSILPTYLSIFTRGMSYLKVIRILRVLRVFRILKLGNHTKQADLLRHALYASRAKIIVFLCFVLTLVVIIGALMYSIEGTLENQKTEFTSIPKSIYWAIVTLTTVGYGDISPQTGAGQCLAAIVMLLGYSIIAVPTGIVTAQIVQTPKKTQPCPACNRAQHEPDAGFCNKCGTQL